MLKISSIVLEAIQYKKPVVALESTLISHGLPYPQNIETAMKLEEVILEQGAVPATVAILDGQVCVGLDLPQKERIAKGGVAKVSMRDISLLIAEKGTGSTTVAATMWAANKAGIRVFATGGIGGVHPGDTMDISSDLPAFATIPVAVVSSGPKAILDIPRTREWFETWGVPILGYKTSYLPAFYTAQTSLSVDRMVQTPQEAAHFIETHLQYCQKGILLAVPIPKEDEIPLEKFHFWHEKAIKVAKEQNISGSALTPFMMEFLRKESENSTLKANVSLLIHNAQVAAQVSIAMLDIR